MLLHLKKTSAFYRFRPVTKSDILSHAYMVYEYPLIRLRSGKKSSINFDVSYPCMNMDTYLSRQSGKILSERSVQALAKEKNDDSAIIHIKYVFPTYLPSHPHARSQESKIFGRVFLPLNASGRIFRL